MVTLATPGAPLGAVLAALGVRPVRTDPFALVVDVGLVLLAGAALVAWRRERRGIRGAWRLALFLLGLVVLFAAWGSALAAAQGTNPSVDVGQHVLLMMVAPPLLVLGSPGVVGRRGAPARTRLRAFASPASGVASWPLYYGSMAAYFLTAAYADSLKDAAWLDLSQVAFVAVGCLFWGGLVGSDRAGRPRSRFFRIGAVVAGMPFETAVGVALLLWGHPLAPGDSLAQTHAAGLLLWVTSMVTSGAALAVLLALWSLEESRASDDVAEGSSLFFESVVSPPDGGARPRPSLRAKPPSRP